MASSTIPFTKNLDVGKDSMGFSKDTLKRWQPMEKMAGGENTMLRKVVLSILVLLIAFCIISCKQEKKELTCDGCGKLVRVKADSKMTDEWILFCQECGEPEITYQK